MTSTPNAHDEMVEPRRKCFLPVLPSASQPAYWPAGRKRSRGVPDITLAVEMEMESRHSPTNSSTSHARRHTQGLLAPTHDP